MAKNGYYGSQRTNGAKRGLLVGMLVAMLAVLLLVVVARKEEDAATASPREDEFIIITPQDVGGQEQANSDPEPVAPLAVASVAGPVVVLQAEEDAAAEWAQELLGAGAQAMAAGDYITARRHLSRALAEGLAGKGEERARQLLNEASEQWLFARNIFAGDDLCQRYKVQPGDALIELGKRFKVPYELLMRINKIKNPRALRAGQTIKVVQGPFRGEVALGRYVMSVYLGDVLVRSYPVAVGKPGRETPTGRWMVKVKQQNPKWIDDEQGKVYYPDDPANPLGERWIGLEGMEGPAKERIGFGIHGTIRPEEIGHSTSRGCIRLHNEDVEELYDLLSSNKSEVYVVD